MRDYTLKKDLLIILIVGLVLTSFAFMFDVDERLASYVYNPQSEFAWFLRQYSQLPMIIISVIFLSFILIPPLRKKYPHLRHNALIWLFSLLFGAGLLVHTVLKDTIDRPRPRETVILGGTQHFTGAFGIQTEEKRSTGNAQAEFKGKSFPSGHVAMASMLIVPFFALRRRKPKLAKSFLLMGTAYGLLVGYGRIVIGAHFFTDVIWGLLCVALTAAIGAHLIKEQSDFKSRYTLALIVFSIFCLAWFNKFTLTMHVVSQAQAIEFIPTCENVTFKRLDENKPFKASITVAGYGGPTSWLVAKENEGQISYDTQYGLFRELSCEATLYLPQNVALSFPSSQENSTVEK
jgi:membrane-associated phospholipid phosphatase